MDVAIPDASTSEDIPVDAPVVIDWPRRDLLRWPTPRSCVEDPACEAPLVIAHRGLHEAVPENSLAAIRAAAAQRLDMVEVDVRETADDVLVLMHDGDVDRTTDGTGDVSGFTYEELSELQLLGGDASSPEASKVPRFAEALRLAAELGIGVYVDVKTNRTDLIAAAILGGNYWDTALVRDDLEPVEDVVARAPGVWTLVPVTTLEEAEHARDAIGGAFVEIALPAPAPELTSSLVAAGFRVQQDVIATGDLPYIATGATSGWAAFVDAGVFALQSDTPVALRDWLATRGE
ncbi:MAG: glycerophosphodiester phosphodiesterase family protein [Myxococcales bacterium]|nr:glycerophosphodiester phosphodiesterase family protein [Myxococcales bacterium]MCB9521673.1 glycerophosphodiester phosphodiesterase family protein [Myxococcales bacterium]MCB9533947.1 glycerophosphodiester phosphodiesterase family protein [Myxococcales bacterium]